MIDVRLDVGQGPLLRTEDVQEICRVTGMFRPEWDHRDLTLEGAFLPEAVAAAGLNMRARDTELRCGVSRIATRRGPGEAGRPPRIETRMGRGGKLIRSRKGKMMRVLRGKRRLDAVSICKVNNNYNKCFLII